MNRSKTDEAGALAEARAAFLQQTDIPEAAAADPGLRDELMAGVTWGWRRAAYFFRPRGATMPPAQERADG